MPTILRKFTFVFFMMFLAGISYTQDFAFGFKAGLTNTSVDGPLESLNNGTELESIKSNGAFLLSLLVNARFTDEFSLQGELMYNQKGYNYRYNGPSYAILRTANNEKFIFNGNRNMSLNVSNTYFQVPLSASYKFFNRIEVQAGIYGSVLVQSTAAGTVTYSDIDAVDGEIEQTLSYNYRTNDAQSASPSAQQVTINNETYTVSSQVEAYYDYETKDKSLFRGIDAGYHAGLNLYINQSLFIGARYSKSIMDINRNAVDRTYQNLDNNDNLIFKNDEDKYSVLEFTIGFSF
ncbi:outer membrane beta-barrel protein [Membranihabitans maritimus]|uniref:outer membrane beta-barrel protein n=1 Tax=Membranihabitans maritimus TaxID=2904244 RepID=UPI001F2C1E8E|nr:outer membrane beta-barrel protein [Membranihabitans maritimus]